MTTLVQCNDCEKNIGYKTKKNTKKERKKKMLPSTSSSILIIQIDLYDQFRKTTFQEQHETYLSS